MNMNEFMTIDGSQDERRYELTELGAYRGGKVVGVVSALPVGIAEAEVGIVGKQLKELDLKSEVRTVEAFGPGNYCYAQLDYDRCSVVFSSVGTYDKSRRAVGNEVVAAVRDFLKVWHPNWDVELQKETLLYKTNQEVIAKFGLHE